MHADGDIFFDGHRATDDFKLPQCDDGWHRAFPATYSNEVTRKQYEAALAAATKPVWNGEGLPPVGCVCEYTKESLGEWTECTIDYVGSSFIVYRDCYGVELTGIICDIQFRPIRSEAHNKKERIVECLVEVYRNALGDTTSAFGCVYDTIAAGKIPGVKLE